MGFNDAINRSTADNSGSGFSDDPFFYMASVSQEVKQDFMYSLFESLNLNGYSICDVGLPTDTGIEVSGKFYLFEEVGKIPFKNGSIEDKVNENVGKK